MNLPTEKWYDLHIKVVDEAGNFVDETIGYALKAVSTTSIENVATTSDNATYYDLSGRRVINPDKGIYIKVQNNTDGSTTRSKVIL